MYGRQQNDCDLNTADLKASRQDTQGHAQPRISMQCTTGIRTRHPRGERDSPAASDGLVSKCGALYATGTASGKALQLIRAR